MKHIKHWSIRTKLFWIFLFLAIIPMVITSYLSYQQAQQALTTLAINKLESEISLTVSRLNTFQEQLRTNTVVLSRLPPIQGIIQALDNKDAEFTRNDTYEDWVTRLNAIFVGQVEEAKLYQQLRYLDEHGQELVRVDYENGRSQIISGEVLQNKADRDYFIKTAKLKDRQVSISPLNLNREQGNVEVPHIPVIRYSTPVYDDEGRFRGIIIANVYANSLLEQLETKEGDIYLVNEDGFYLTHPDETKTFGFDLDHESKLVDDFPVIDQILQIEDNYSDIDDDRQEIITAQKVYFDPDDQTRYWIIINTLPNADVLDIVYDFQILVLRISGGSIIIVIFLALISTRLFTQPITNLRALFEPIKQGDFSPRATVTTQDEFGELATGFNQLLDQLEQLFETMRQERDHLQQTVEAYVEFAKQVANGDLTIRLPVDDHNTDNDLVKLGHNLNNMVTGLAQLTQQVQEATSNISSASAEILAATTQQAAGANEQSAAISQTTSTISQVKAIVEQSYNKAEGVAQQSRQTHDIYTAGQTAVENTIDSMSQIREKVAGIAENILALSERTQQIGEITATVNEIAAQSNLLALNASVEAARAGEHGKGFAVVAVEVRNLAEQSRQATAQVKTILNEIQQATNAAVMATEEGTKGVDAGVILTRQTGETIRQLSENIAENANRAQQIVASAQQQATGMKQITIAMENISQATAQSLASTRQTERSAQDLTSVAQQLEAIVAQYKLN